LDIGCGPGYASAILRKRWPKARVIALDSALPMLRQAKRQTRWFRSFIRLCGDANALPLADQSVDVIFSNLCLPWLENLPEVLAGFRRILRPGGRLLCSTFGPDTLRELQDIFARVDTAPHVMPFFGISTLGDALITSGFRDPVLDCDRLTVAYPDLTTLMRELQATGMTNALQSRRRTLTGRRRFIAVADIYETLRNGDGMLPTTWEIIYLQAWAPEHGVPIRSRDGGEVASMPVSAIPIRRREPQP
ncbi:MAG: methyltransferase domain-containing protein, partial [Xanthomonadaceae bacterium]|jgi:malonyl-CoA O-methyltransferase|nr:methyltransferase domain-containing protein [Xanthomonadaceae bacterium]